VQQSASRPNAGERLTNLNRLFAPRSVAVVGASASPDKAGYQALLKLKDFPGEVFPINPKGGEILGRKAYPSLAAVGKPVDLVIFAVPAAACPDAVQEAINCKCSGGLIISGGFAEAGPEGAALQDRITELCRSSNFRLLGPNTAGFVNMNAGLVATFAAGTEHMRPGKVAVVASSGGITFIVSYLLLELGYGISACIGLGNVADIDVADALDFLAQDEGTASIAMYLEGVPDGRRLYDTLRRVTPQKPVVALIVGREDVGEFAQSHTGNLIGSYDLKLNALRQAGAVVVNSTDELAAAAAVFSTCRVPPRENPGIGVLTGQGGAGVVMLDWLKAAGASVPTVRDETFQRISKLLPPMTYLKNPVDTARPGPTWGDVLVALAGDDQIDAVIAWALHEPATLHPETLLPELKQTLGKPLVFGTAGADADIRPTIETLRKHGIFTAESPERLAQAGAVLFQDSQAQWKLSQKLEAPVTCTVQVPSGPVDEHAAKQLLESVGIRTPKRAACSTRAEALAAFKSLSKPVVAKILSSEIGHKTEAGGVHLHIKDEEALNRALDALDKIPLKGERRYLIEEMAPPGVEMIIGAVRDPSFGPTIMVGLGGTIAEAIKDTSTRVAPISLATAHDMLNELRASALLDGWRGSPKTDRNALAQVIVRLASLLDQQPNIRDIEINPVRAYADGVLALDALIVTK
jgi:acyl-CoA synthetase (NDP forming)